MNNTLCRTSCQKNCIRHCKLLWHTLDLANQQNGWESNRVTFCSTACVYWSFAPKLICLHVRATRTRCPALAGAHIDSLFGRRRKIVVYFPHVFGAFDKTHYIRLLHKLHARGVFSWNTTHVPLKRTARITIGNKLWWCSSSNKIAWLSKNHIRKWSDLIPTLQIMYCKRVFCLENATKIKIIALMGNMQTRSISMRPKNQCIYWHCTKRKIKI